MTYNTFETDRDIALKARIEELENEFSSWRGDESFDRKFNGTKSKLIEWVNVEFGHKTGKKPNSTTKEHEEKVSKARSEFEKTREQLRYEAREIERISWDESTLSKESIDNEKRHKQSLNIQTRSNNLQLVSVFISVIALIFSITGMYSKNEVVLSSDVIEMIKKEISIAYVDIRNELSLKEKELATVRKQLQLLFEKKSDTVKKIQSKK